MNVANASPAAADGLLVWVSMVYLQSSERYQIEVH
jgi:hypothetical protein